MHGGSQQGTADSGIDNDSGAPELGRPQRVAKVIARYTRHSRRDAERFIAAGQVTVNGDVLESPATNVDVACDQIRLDGKLVGTYRQPPRLFVAYKLPGELVTRSDPQGRPTLFDRLEAMGVPRNLVAVGRLDLKSEGVILLTNDGELASYLEHPDAGLNRTYNVKVYGHLKPNMFSELKRGLVVDGVRYRPIHCSVLREGHGDHSGHSWLRITLTEGKNREVRRVMEHYRLRVVRLIRKAYGASRLAKLRRGEAVEMDAPAALIATARGWLRNRAERRQPRATITRRASPEPVRPRTTPVQDLSKRARRLAGPGFEDGVADADTEPAARVMAAGTAAGGDWGGEPEAGVEAAGTAAGGDWRPGLPVAGRSEAPQGWVTIDELRARLERDRQDRRRQALRDR